MDREKNEEFFEYLGMVEEARNAERVPKRYIRDAENPLEFYGDLKFRNRYRFSKDTVLYIILSLIADRLMTVNNRGLPFSPLIQLLVCLRFYATGNFEVISGDLRGISQQTVSVIVKRISVLLAEQTNRFIKYPEMEGDQCANIIAFQRVAGFPGVGACLDCTQIPIASPGGDNAEVFRTRKGYFSLNIQVAAGPQMEILDIVVRHPVSTHDSVIFDRSALRVRFEQRQISDLLLGDNGYPCRPYLLTPVIHPRNEHETRYNTAHIRTRNLVERVFSVWKRRFSCLHRVLKTKLETSIAIICAAAVLHNIEVQQNDYIVNDENDIDVGNIPNINDRGNNQLGLMFRAEFINRNFFK